jgi:hypothetical protein
MQFDSQNEANTLIALIDMAVKAGGLQVAEAGLHFIKKIKADFPDPPPADPVVPDQSAN